jgi:hypothetical protein
MVLKELIHSKIYDFQGNKIMFDFDLAELYDVETRTLKQAVRRNISRFPNDFLILLSKAEWRKLITSCDKLPETVKYSPAPPFAFTEQGVAMLASVLKSEKAILVNIAIMRAFVFMRQYAMNHKDLSEKLAELENTYSMKFKDIYAAINYLLKKDKGITEHKNRKRIGFRQDKLNP